MQIDIQKIIEGYNREIGALTQRAILAEATVAALQEPAPADPSAEPNQA